MVRRQPATGNNKSDIPVGKCQRYPGGNSASFARSERVTARCVQVCASIAGVGILRHLSPGDKYLNVVNHESRLVQKCRELATQTTKSVCNGEVIIYRERLWPTAWLYLSTALTIPASILVFMPINIIAGYITAAILYGGIVLFLLASAPTIEVDETELRAGKARLPIATIGTVLTFDGAEATLERGQRLDARAWLLIRGWVSAVAKLEILDESDPTPYWLLSSRTPELLSEAIVKAKLRTPNK
ncbi:DUF3093 family protein [Rhodoglobus vestalii]|uniref:DUF3093 family protein n=1 Tax=Rhodoglobus vestalii TaxID=193384 RepID=A0A8H2K8N1_9MICO|nr:DUF3093 family protein [Rhodoglobus vestalii]